MNRMGAGKLAGAVLAAGLSAWAASAQDKGALSDAQIESNVLKALANAPELASENIQTSTSFGTVTMSGAVRTEEARNKAEDLVSRASGVRKVVDEMTVGESTAQAAPAATEAAATPAGSSNEDAPELANMAPVDGPQDGAAPAAQASAPGGERPAMPPADHSYDGADEASNAGSQQAPPPEPPDAERPAYGQQPPYPQQTPYPQQPSYSGQSPQPPYGQPGYNQPGYGEPQPYDRGEGAPSYSEGSAPPPARRPMYRNVPPPGYEPEGGQRAGLPVTIPPGALLRVRINRGIDSQHIKPGTVFDGIVLSDVAADGAIAIPRGATVNLVVADAQKTRELSGQGQLALQVTSVSLGGRVYPLQTDVWHRTGADKTSRTVDSAVGLGALGAIVGAVAGGGAGAAVGAGVGAGAGVAASAGSPGGRVLVPAEAVLTFRTTEPAEVQTVSEAEMQRLSYAAGPGQPQPRRYYRPYPAPYPYYGPVYYYGR